MAFCLVSMSILQRQVKQFVKILLKSTLIRKTFVSTENREFMEYPQFIDLPLTDNMTNDMFYQVESNNSWIAVFSSWVLVKLLLLQ